MENLIYNCEPNVESELYLKQLKKLLVPFKSQLLGREERKNKLLCRAIYKSLYSTVTLMIEHGFPVNIVEFEKSNGLPYMIPIEIAVKYSDDKMVNLLLDKGADPNCITPSLTNSTPLCEAIRKNSCSTVKLLLERGADPNKYPNNRYFGDLPPISYAIQSQLKKIITLLIKHNVNLNVDCTVTNAVLIYPKCLPYLIRHGLDLNHKNHRREETALHNQELSLSQVKLLLNFGANPRAKDKYGRTPVKDLYKRENCEEIEQLFLKSEVSLPSLHTFCLRYILIHNIDVTGVPKSVLKFES